jgi:filamentous hemagglutinin family protein
MARSKGARAIRGAASSAYALRPAAVAVALCLGAGAAWANPTGPAVVNGQVTINQAGNLLSITNSPNSIINWQSFSIGANEVTRFTQQSAASAVLNRVVGAGGTIDPSVILGALQSNGRVFLVNPSGIVFGAGAQVDVAGLVASSLNLSNADFLGGRLRLSEVPGAGAVVNQGAISAASGGQVYLVGPAVTNSGIITSPRGEVILAAGNTVELVSPGTPDLRVEITAPRNQARNLGSIVADAGRVGIYAGLINHSGTIRANGAVATEDGRIMLRATRNVTLEAGSVTTANGPAGGSITIQSGDTTLVSGAIEATGSSGRGGSVQVLGNLVGLMDRASINAAGESGGGTVLVGGGYGGRNPAVQNAFRTYFGPDATISADAIGGGDGGKVIVWSDDATRAYGTISARGGSRSGNGGFVETSGGVQIDVADIRVNASGPAGAAGTWLLDPSVDITVIHQTGGSSIGSPFAPGSNSSISDSTINATLAGTNLTIQTNGGSGGSGDIVFQDDTVAIVSSGGGRVLALNADRDIVLRGSITSAGGNLDVNLNAAGQVITPSGATFTLNGTGATTVLAHVNNSRTWNNNGVIALTGTSVIHLPNPGGGYATFSNNPGATLNINSAAGWSFLSDSSVQGGIVRNAGTLNLVSGTSWEAAFTNTSTGTLNIAPAINLSMQNGQTIAGNVSIGAGANFWVSERHGTNALFLNTAIAGTGTLLVQTGSSPVADITNVSAPGITLRINGGTANILNGTSTFGGLNLSAGSLTLNNGTFAQTSGTLSVPSGVTYSGTVGYEVGSGGTLNIANNISTASGSVKLGAGSISGSGNVSASGDVEMIATSGNLAVRGLSAGGFAILRATQGAITDANGSGVNNVTARHLEAAAKNGIDLDTAISGGFPSYVNATNSASGNIAIRNTGPAATIQNIHNAGGNNVLSGLVADANSTVATGGIVVHGDWGTGSGGPNSDSAANPRFAFSTTGGNVVITLNSPRASQSQSDPYLYLLSANGTVLAQDDDNGLQGYVAVINPPNPLNQFPGFGSFGNVIDLAPGNYIVVAATFSPGQQTPFDLSIAGPVSSVLLPAPSSGAAVSQLSSGVNRGIQQVIAATNRLAEGAAPGQDRDELVTGTPAEQRKKALPICGK